MEIRSSNELKESCSLPSEAPHCLPFLPEGAKMGPGVKSNGFDAGCLSARLFCRAEKEAPDEVSKSKI